MIAPYLAFLVCMFHIARHERRIAVTRNLEMEVQSLLTSVQASQEIEEQAFVFLKDESGYSPGLPWETYWGNWR